MSDSPASIIFNTDGYEAGVLLDNTDFDLEERAGVLIAGVDGYTSRLVRVTEAGSLRVTPSPARTTVGRYYISSNLIDGSSSSQTLLSLYNPFGSARIAYINRVTINGVTSGISSVPFLYKIQRGTQGLPPENGTVLPIQLGNTLDSASMLIIMEGPDGYVDNGLIWATCPGVSTSAGFFNSNNFEAFNTEDSEFELVLHQGESLLIQSDANSNNWSHWVTASWNEVIDPQIIQPDDIFADMFAWYRADSVDTDVDGYATTLLDKTGQARNFGPYFGHDPGYLMEVNADFNDRETINFFDSTGYKYSGDKADFKFLHDGTGFTCIFVTKPTRTDGTFNCLFRTGLGSGSNGIELFRETSGNRLEFLIDNTDGSGGSIISPIFSPNGTFPLDVPTVLFFEFEYAVPGDDYNAEIDGLSLISGDSGGVPADADPLFVFLGQNGGDIAERQEFAELIILDRRITTEEKNAVYNYINAYYGI